MTTLQWVVHLGRRARARGEITPKLVWGFRESILTKSEKIVQDRSWFVCL